jgi:tetratricopeptide (TPR) repeat protein
MLNILLILLSVVSVNDSMINKAVQLFETRHLNSTYLTTSVNMLEQALKDDTGNVYINYMLSQVYYTIADHAEQKKDKLDNYYKGLWYGNKAIQIDYNSAWAHFWHMACLSRIALIKGIFNSLVSVGESKKEIDIVLSLDPNNVMAYNAKAMIYYELPGILGGDVNKSILFLKRAIGIDSNYSMAYVTLGKCYIKKKDYKTARMCLNQVLSLQNGWPVADFIMDDKPEAVQLLKEIEGR